MPFKKIIENLYLGSQFANEKKIKKELKISNVFYDILNTQKSIIKNDEFVLTNDKCAIKMFDTHSESDFNNRLFAYGVKFINENITENEIYTHCHLGVSRSASMVFVYLVIKGYIKERDFDKALAIFITDYYPYMKVNLGTYTYLKNNFPFKEVKDLSQQDWDYFVDKYYIDFDWNQVSLYKNNQLVLTEKALIIKNLVTKKVLHIGQEAWEHLSDEENLINCVLFENQKVLSNDNLDIFMYHFLIKHNLNNKDYYLVDRYENLNESWPKITEKDFLKLFFIEDYYLDLRNNETIIMNRITNELIKIPKGRIAILQGLTKYFYLGYGATLNTPKTLALLDNLANQKVDRVLCRSFETGEDKWVLIDSYNDLLSEIKSLYQDINHCIHSWLFTYKTESFRKVFDLCDKY